MPLPLHSNQFECINKITKNPHVRNFSSYIRFFFVGAAAAVVVSSIRFSLAVQPGDGFLSFSAPLCRPSDDDDDDDTLLQIYCVLCR